MNFAMRQKQFSVIYFLRSGGRSAPKKICILYYFWVANENLLKTFATFKAQSIVQHPPKNGPNQFRTIIVAIWFWRTTNFTLRLVSFA